MERAVELACQNKQHKSKTRRLRRANRRLKRDKRDVARQVDLLCHDLIAGYQELAERVQELEEHGASGGEDFAAAVEGELDLEAVIRKTLEHLVSRVGACNAAVYLPATADEYSLAGYVNHDCGAEAAEMVLEHLADVLAPEMSERIEPVYAGDEAGLRKLLGDDAAWLAGRQLLAATCWGKGEPLAVFALFRDEAQPFDAAAEEAVRAGGGDAGSRAEPRGAGASPGADGPVRGLGGRGRAMGHWRKAERCNVEETGRFARRLAQRRRDEHPLLGSLPVMS